MGVGIKAYIQSKLFNHVCWDPDNQENVLTAHRVAVPSCLLHEMGVKCCMRQHQTVQLTHKKIVF